MFGHSCFSIEGYSGKIGSDTCITWWAIMRFIKMMTVSGLLICLGTTVSTCANPGEELVRTLENLLKVEYIAFKNLRDEEIIVKVKENIREELKDPDSANFRNVRILRINQMIYACGQVNAKNALGGYTGFKWFLASPISVGYFETESAGQLLIPKYCVY